MKETKKADWDKKVGSFKEYLYYDHVMFQPHEGELDRRLDELLVTHEAQLREELAEKIKGLKEDEHAKGVDEDAFGNILIWNLVLDKVLKLIKGGKG